MRAYYAFDGHGFDEDKARVALTTLLRDPNLGRVWLILDGEAPVGYVVIAFGYSLEWLGRDAFVDEFYLLQEYRGSGWGRKTMAHSWKMLPGRSTSERFIWRSSGKMQRRCRYTASWASRNARAPSCRSGSLRIFPSLARKTDAERLTLDDRSQPNLFPPHYRSRVNFCYASIALPRSGTARL